MPNAEPLLDKGEDTRLLSSSSPPVARPPPLRRVKPPAEAMWTENADFDGIGDWEGKLVGWRFAEVSTIDMRCNPEQHGKVERKVGWTATIVRGGEKRANKVVENGKQR